MWRGQSRPTFAGNKEGEGDPLQLHWELGTAVSTSSSLSHFDSQLHVAFCIAQLNPQSKRTAAVPSRPVVPNPREATARRAAALQPVIHDPIDEGSARVSAESARVRTGSYFVRSRKKARGGCSVCFQAQLICSTPCPPHPRLFSGLEIVFTAANTGAKQVCSNLPGSSHG